ncbi:hypothetical protein F4774DRAFT_193300 [Daldinia eschscholtzii]|nr:hypothetical protein F4774DRAFT_193300 [Daldinia eschscholtzii]
MSRIFSHRLEIGFLCINPNLLPPASFIVPKRRFFGATGSPFWVFLYLSKIKIRSCYLSSTRYAMSILMFCRKKKLIERLSQLSPRQSQIFFALLLGFRLSRVRSASPRITKGVRKRKFPHKVQGFRDFGANVLWSFPSALFVVGFTAGQTWPAKPWLPSVPLSIMGTTVRLGISRIGGGFCRYLPCADCVPVGVAVREPGN